MTWEIPEKHDHHKKTHDLLVSLSPPTKKIREKLTHSKAITLHLPHFPFPTPPGHLESMTSVADIGTTFQTEPSPKAAIHTPRNSFPMDKSQEGGSIHGNPKPSFLGVISPIYLGFKTFIFPWVLGFQGMGRCRYISRSMNFVDF